MGIPAFEAAVSSQGEGSGAAGHNSDDPGIVCLEVLLPAVLVHPHSPIRQPHPDVEADGCHGGNACPSFLSKETKKSMVGASLCSQKQLGLLFHSNQ